MALTSGNFLTNSGTPLVGNGSNGDHYRNTDNEDLWFKQLGVWTLVGNLNDDAADGIGTIWLSGSGTPLTGNGDNGNYYRNSDNQDLWYKVGGFWTLVGTLLPVAAEGTTILSGSGVPSGGTGVDDDYYRDTVTQDIYLKAAGVWNLIGSWAAVTAGTTILSGSGVPSNGSGADGNYYFNSVNQDIYLRSGGIWVVVGSWAAGGAADFVVGTWNMTGAMATAEPVSTLAATVGGVAPDFELTPTAPLSGAPGSYMAIAGSASGVAKTGTGQKFAKVTLPVADVGDNLVGVSFFFANSSATELDLVALLNGGTPTNAVWGINTTILAPAYGGFSVSQTYTNSIAGASVVGPSGWVDSDIAYFGFDYDTGNAVIQKNAGSVTQLGALDLTGFPVGDTMKVFVLLGFLGTPGVFLDAPIVFSLGTTDGGKTPFMTEGDAVLPPGAADGLVYEVTVGGQFGGKQTVVGDYAQLYDSTTKIIVTSAFDTSPLEVDIQAAADQAAAAAAAAAAATGEILDLWTAVNDGVKEDNRLAHGGGKYPLVIDLTGTAPSSTTFDVDLAQYDHVVIVHDLDVVTEVTLKATYSGPSSDFSATSTPVEELQLQPVRVTWLVQNQGSVAAPPVLGKLWVLIRQGGGVLASRALALHGMTGGGGSEPDNFHRGLEFELIATATSSSSIAPLDVSFSSFRELKTRVAHPGSNQVTLSDQVHSESYYPGVYFGSPFTEVLVRPYFDSYGPEVLMVDFGPGPVPMEFTLTGAGSGRRTLYFATAASSVTVTPATVQGLSMPSSFAAGTVLEFVLDSSGIPTLVRAEVVISNPSLGGTVDVLGREALTEVPGMVVDTTLRGKFKVLDVTADAQSFPLSLSGGVDCQILIQASPSYTPGGSDTVSILGYTFKVDSHLSQMLLEHTQTAGGLITNTRVLHKSPSLPVLTQALADAVTSLASLAHVTSPVLELDNSALTGPLASYDLSTASGPWRTLHGEVLVKLVGSTAHGITNFDGTGTALAVGEGVLIRGSSPSTQQYLKVVMM